MKKYINALGMILLAIVAMPAVRKKKELLQVQTGHLLSRYMNMQLKHRNITLTMM